MRGVIVPPSKLIVKTKIPPKGRFFIRGGLLLGGGDYIYTGISQQHHQKPGRAPPPMIIPARQSEPWVLLHPVLWLRHFTLRNWGAGFRWQSAISFRNFRLPPSKIRNGGGANSKQRISLCKNRVYPQSLWRHPFEMCWHHHYRLKCHIQYMYIHIYIYIYICIHYYY